MSPEMLKHIKIDDATNYTSVTSKKAQYGFKVDVFSYGIVLWSILTENQPYNKLRTLQDIQDAVLTNRRPTIPDDSPQSWIVMIGIMKQCWRENPKDRPNFKK
eukprot:UN01410